MFRGLVKSILRQAPSQCAVCRAWPAYPVCEACVVRFAQPQSRCRLCALPVSGEVKQCGACVRKPPPLDTCVAAVGYEYPWSGLIVEFKFRARPGWASSFATLLRSTPWVEPALEKATLVVPMPLSAQRLRERGFNQAQEIARHVAAITGIALLPRACRKVRDTAPQAALPWKERAKNVRKAFVCDEDFTGRHVAVVDDVMTTGATLNEIARNLKRAGATRVTGLIVTRTLPDAFRKRRSQAAHV